MCATPDTYSILDRTMDKLPAAVGHAYACADHCKHQLYLPGPKLVCKPNFLPNLTHMILPGWKQTWQALWRAVVSAARSHDYERTVESCGQHCLPNVSHLKLVGAGHTQKGIITQSLVSSAESFHSPLFGSLQDQMTMQL